MKTAPSVPQERFPPELVEQVIDWQARVKADKTLLRTAEFDKWVMANAPELNLPKYHAHFKELYLAIRAEPKGQS